MRNFWFSEQFRLINLLFTCWQYTGLVNFTIRLFDCPFQLSTTNSRPGIKFLIMNSRPIMLIGFKKDWKNVDWIIFRSAFRTLCLQQPFPSFQLHASFENLFCLFLYTLYSPEWKWQVYEFEYGFVLINIVKLFILKTVWRHSGSVQM